MRGREAQHDAAELGLPRHEAAGELALAGNPGRPELAVVRPQRAEHDRPRFDREALAQREHARQLQVANVEMKSKYHLACMAAGGGNGPSA